MQIVDSLQLPIMLIPRSLLLGLPLRLSLSLSLTLECPLRGRRQRCVALLESWRAREQASTVQVNSRLVHERAAGIGYYHSRRACKHRKRVFCTREPCPRDAPLRGWWGIRLRGLDWHSRKPRFLPPLLASLPRSGCLVSESVHVAGWAIVRGLVIESICVRNLPSLAIIPWVCR